MARRKTTIDFESRSCADLPKVGGWRYAEDETTDIICLAFKTGDDDTVAWVPPWVIEEFGVELGYHTHPETGRVYLFTDDPSALWDAIAEGDIIEAHNAFFERSLWRNIMTKRYGWPDIPDTSWMCSAAKAAAYSLPRALEKACEVVKTDVAKDDEGAALIRRLCKPRKPTKNDPRVFFGSKEEYERFILYCCEDVEAEHAFSAKLPDLVPFEQRVWQVDQAINERGVYCDIQMVNHIMEMIAEQLDSLTTELRELTDGAINTVGSRKAALEWIADHGYELPNTQGKTLDEFLAEDGIDPVVYRVVQIIRIANRTSTKKFDAMVRRINRDSRIRDTLMYHGANTGRWAGRGVQFQNLPRGVATVMDIVCAMILENDLAGIAQNVEEDAMIWQAVDDGLITKDMAKDLARYTSAASDPMELFASVVRGAVCAPEGRELIVADYSAIEARGVLWAAGDQRALDVFRRGEDIYCDMASTIFGRTITKADAKERQVGKAIILACLAEDTVVLTSNGPKCIIDVTTDDMLWDGHEWVTHDGLAPKGRMGTIKLNGVQMTPNHLVLGPKNQFIESHRVLRENIRLPLLGTSLASSLSLKLPMDPEAELNQSSASAPAGRGPSRLLRTYWQAARAAAMSAQNRHHGRKTIGNTSHISMTMPIEDDCSTGFPRKFQDATTQTTNNSITMADGELLFGAIGGTTKGLSCPTSKLLMGGKTQSLKSTESTTTKDTNRETSILLPENQTCGTDELYQNSSVKMTNCVNVYDLLNSGPRNQFTVICPNGDLMVVSNCGYSMGANKFLQTCRAQGMVFEMELINQLVSPAKYREIEEAILKLPMVYFKDGITKADMPELVMAKFLVDSYRAKYSMVVDLWNDCEEAAMCAIDDHRVWKAIEDPAQRPKKVWHKAGPVAYKVVSPFLFCKLPSGRMLAYAHPSLRMAKTSWGQEKLTIHFMGVNSMTKKWGRQTTYGGKLVENIVQAISRDMMAYAMVNVEEDPRYDLVLTVHDEIVTEVDEGTGSVEEFEEMIIQKPDWAEGLPMDAEGWRGKRYRK